MQSRTRKLTEAAMARDAKRSHAKATAWYRQVVALLNRYKVNDRSDWTIKLLTDSRGDEPEDSRRFGITPLDYMKALVQEYELFGSDGE